MLGQFGKQALFLGASDDDIVAKTGTHFLNPARGDPAGGNERVQIRGAPIGLARLVHDKADEVFVIFALAVDLDRRDAHAFLENRACVDRHRPGDLAADVGLVAEHRGIGDQAAILEHGQEHEPVIGMADRPTDRIGIGQEDHVAVFQRAFIIVEEAADEAAELADNHLAGVIGDQREGIALFADTGRHGGAHKGGIHFNARVAQRVFHDVEGDRINGHLLERRGVGLNDRCRHGCVPSVRPD